MKSCETPPTVRVVNWSNRPWINRSFQQFTGRYLLDENSGLYFDAHTASAHRSLISDTFLLVPETLRQVALELALTVSATDKSRTHCGALSAVYGAWEQSDRARISPHLEMAATSLTEELVFPHLVHEVSHLFWAIQCKAARASFTRRMIRMAEGNFTEVTTYAQGCFDQWQNLILNEGDQHCRCVFARDRWVTESFCETVAKICFPAYMSRQNRDTKELIEARRVAVADCFDLHLVPVELV